MLPVSDFDIYIFDCDGVILDSNTIKVKAMEAALQSVPDVIGGIDVAIEYFRNNFGNTRSQHADAFVDNYLAFSCSQDSERVKRLILEQYNKKLELCYSDSEFVPGIKTFLNNLSGKRYVASGSEQLQLREILSAKNISNVFDGIFGAPKPKTQIVSEIIASFSVNSRALMFGDAMADLQAAKKNSVSFVGVIGHSNVPDKLAELCHLNDYPVIENFLEWK